MNTKEFVNLIVVPTLKEALEARHDRRRNYLACIVVFHTMDYLSGGDETICKRDIQPNVRACCQPSFDLVQSVANGAKHAGGRKWLKPGTERDIPIFAFDVPGAGWGEGRWKVPGLGIKQGDNELMLDWCVQLVLLTLCKLYSTELGEVDLAWMDAAILQNPPTVAK